jgi:hypothetical protein
MAAPDRTAAAILGLLALPLALGAGGCAHQPREFDVSPQASEERLPAPGPVAANLAGNWEFNPRESDQPGAGRGYGDGGGRGAMGGGRRPGMGGRGGFPGAGGVPGTGGDYPGSAGMPPRPDAGGSGGRSGGGGGRAEGARGDRDSSMAGGVAWRLQLAQTDSTLTITRATGSALTLFFDGRTVYVADAHGEGQNEVSGRWNRKRFEVRRALADGRTVVESYELTANGMRLSVRTKVTGGDPSEYAPPEIRRVYDRVAEPGPKPATPPASTQRIGA